MAEKQSGDLLGGRYRLIEVIGSGGMGRVWKGHDEQLDRPVAVKEVTMPTMPAAEREDRLTRAEREGRNAALLADHPNIVTIYDVVIEDGVPWTVMQLVQGQALHRRLADGPLDVDAVARIAEAMLTALKAAHDAGVVHRDVKPANIMLGDDDRVLLTDFGIARAEGDQTVTVTGAFVGSLAYVAPERAEGKDGGPESDLFSLGVTLFEAVEGTSPFRRDSTTGTLTAILVKPLPPMRRAGRLAPLITALTQKDPDDRPSSEQALRMLEGRDSGWRAPSATGEADTESAVVRSALRSADAPWEEPSARLRASGGPTPTSENTITPPAGQGPSKSTQMVLACLAVVGIVVLAVTLSHQHSANNTANNMANDTPTPTPPATASYDPATATTTSGLSTPDTPTADPACSEFSQALTSFHASQQGLPSQLSPEQEQSQATEWRGYADQLDQIANDSTDPAVKSAINAYATDSRTLSNDFTAGDIDAVHNEVDQFGSDGNAVIQACKDNGL